MARCHDVSIYLVVIYIICADSFAVSHFDVFHVEQGLAGVIGVGQTYVFSGSQHCRVALCLPSGATRGQTRMVRRSGEQWIRTADHVFHVERFLTRIGFDPRLQGSVAVIPRWR